MKYLVLVGLLFVSGCGIDAEVPGLSDTNEELLALRTEVERLRYTMSKYGAPPSAVTTNQ